MDITKDGGFNHITRAYEDKHLIQDANILETLLILEEHQMKSGPLSSLNETCDCVGLKPEIRPAMRTIVASWMLEVCEEQRLEDDTFLLSINYLNRILKISPAWRKNHLQLLGAACMHLASKLKDTVPITGPKLVMYTDFSITLEGLQDMELLVLKKLNWDLSVVTAYDFVEQILHRLHDMSNEIMETVKRHTKTFIDLANTEYSFIQYTPSLLAGSCITAALSGILSDTVVAKVNIHGRICDIIRCDLVWLKECQSQIEQELHRSIQQPDARDSAEHPEHQVYH